mgnify:CR=1 FL=1
MNSGPEVAEQPIAPLRDPGVVHTGSFEHPETGINRQGIPSEQFKIAVDVGQKIGLVDEQNRCVAEHARVL